MRFLITGGAGFLGLALANHLAQTGNDVRVIDDLSNGDQSRLLPDIHFTRANIQDVPRLWSLLQDVDCVYHLAARVSVAESVKYPSRYNETNVGGTVALLEGIRDAGVKRVVMASSGAVYGSQPHQPISESIIPSPDSPYAVSKLAAEQYLHTIGKLWGIETVALRIFNAYGVGQPLPVSHAPAVPHFLRSVLSGGSAVIHGDGTQTRDFVYIDDVVDALVRCATYGSINRRVLNIGSGEETSINQLIDTMGDLTHKKVNYLYNTSKTGGVPRLVADISQATQKLDFAPQISLREGLSLVLAHDHRFADS